MHGHRPCSRGSSGARTLASRTLARSGVDSKPLYRFAMSYNRGLDHDKDGIACEKAWSRGPHGVKQPRAFDREVPLSASLRRNRRRRARAWSGAGR